ncbi:hypothetical protein GJ496_000431 [Pomphorhynchus laevis]|nr:hypothetical protein GJ496_000431 [Pomphorhynchus laevis]
MISSNIDVSEYEISLDRKISKIMSNFGIHVYPVELRNLHYVPNRRFVNKRRRPLNSNDYLFTNLSDVNLSKNEMEVLDLDLNFAPATGGSKDRNSSMCFAPQQNMLSKTCNLRGEINKP